MTSVQYPVARALIDGRVGAVDEEGVNDPRVRGLMEKIRPLELDEKLDAAYPRLMSAAVTIETKHGVYDETVTSAKGTADNPVSDEDLEAKFLELAQSAVTRTRAEALLDCIWNLEEVQDIHKLTALLGA